MKKHNVFTLALCIWSIDLFAVSSILPSASTHPALPRPEFMQLYNDFVAYSKDTEDPSIGQALIQTLASQAPTTQSKGAMVLVMNSNMYIYDSNGKKLLEEAFHAEPNTGFYEMTAISHLGPAISYLLAIKNYGGDWKSLMVKLQGKIQAVQAVNNDKKNPWLQSVDAKAWKPYLSQIQAMSTYGLAMTNAFLGDVLSGKIEFTEKTVNDTFLSGNAQYPIPFNNVMVGTFMLTTLTSMYDIYSKIEKLNLDWKNTKVILRFLAGSNYTAGLTLENNWLAYYLISASNNTLPSSRIYIIPFAEIRDSLTKDQLTAGDFDYYANQLWGSVDARTGIAKKMYPSIPSMYIPRRAAIPGDYNYSKNHDIDDFIVRLKFSLETSTEMLSNSTAFWMAGELADKKWDYKKVDIPGLNSGFPEGITEYPSPA
ncbi:MAG: hypothetical protein CMF52_05065 [Legionellales bacterium]|nr:hypothetical protein [Legionellales bacterium]